MSRPLITQARLKELVHYDPITGLFRWRISRGRAVAGVIIGHIQPNGSIYICVDKGHYKAHRLAWLYVYGVWPKDGIDHIDLDPSHNWIANLREATQSQNNANRRYVPNNSGLKGVYRCKNGRYRAHVKIHRKKIHLGFFDDPLAAQAAYVAAAKKLFGEFARAE